MYTTSLNVISLPTNLSLDSKYTVPWEYTLACADSSQSLANNLDILQQILTTTFEVSYSSNTMLQVFHECNFQLKTEKQ